MTSVFVDASAWVAIHNRKDRHHSTATAIYNKLLDQRTTMITSSWTVYEALSILKSKAGLREIESLWSIASNPRLVILVRVNEAIEKSALDIFFRYKDKDWGVVDCASLIIMKELSCTSSFAFDIHFAEASKQYGFALLTA